MISRRISIKFNRKENFLKTLFNIRTIANAVGLIVLLVYFVPDVKAQSESDWFMRAANDYIEECLLDTLKAIRVDDDLRVVGVMDSYNYIIDRGSYREMVTMQQLEEEGYEYKYRWIIKTDPFEFEYIFLREPTFKGFVKWFERKIAK